ncbi:amino acid permease [Phlebopus sp. FC_14]|nr:amino acid permease [Phlebopus sp. FC_14]
MLTGGSLSMRTLAIDVNVDQHREHTAATSPVRDQATSDSYLWTSSVCCISSSSSTMAALQEKKLDASDVSDAESSAPPQRTLHRQLKNRHIAMISIGGVIGTGLFIGTANSLSWGGPVGLLLGYITMGTIVFSVMVSLGEMVAYLPIPGGHIKLAERFVDPGLSFAMGWNYWYNWTIIVPAEISAAALIIDYWHPNVNNAVWVMMCLIVAVTINMLGAGAYGEAEFVFASIKVLTITGLIILGIVLDLGGGPNHDRIGFRYWKNPGPFVQYKDISGAKGRFLGWWAVMTQAAFSFIGTEIVAIAAGEAKNPRRNLPKAIRRVYIRILLFYIGGTFVIGLLVPSNNSSLQLESGTAASPFVIAIQTAGIKSLPSIINACLLSSAWSASSSDIYTSSRALYGLAASGNAPKIFLKTSKTGLPYVSVLFCSLFTLLAFMAVSSGAGNVFTWLSNMTAIAGLMTWFGISVTYIRFYKGLQVQGIDRRSLPYWNRLQPFAAWYTCIATLVICLFSGWSVFLRNNWDTATFVTNYLPFILFPILYIGARLYYRVKPVSAAQMDFISDIDQIEADEVDDPPPKNKVDAFWQWLM